MDSFELSKIAGAVLLAMLLIFGGKTIIELNQGGHGGGEHEVVGYALPAPEPTEAGAGAAAAPEEAAFDFAGVATAAETADAAAGEAVFKKCMACHTTEQGGANKVGPNLFGVVGRAKASHEGFNYSGALKELGGQWTLEDLAHFVHKPKSFLPGTKMVFGGIAGEKDLANLLAYLNTLH